MALVNLRCNSSHFFFCKKKMKHVVIIYTLKMKTVALLGRKLSTFSCRNYSCFSCSRALLRVPRISTSERAVDSTSLVIPVGYARAFSANHRHKKVLRLAKGYRGRSNRCFRLAKQRVHIQGFQNV